MSTAERESARERRVRIYHWLATTDWSNDESTRIRTYTYVLGNSEVR